MQNFALLVHSESTYFSTQRQPYDWESAQTAPMRIYKSTAEKKDNFKLSIFMLDNRRCDFFPIFGGVPLKITKRCLISLVSMRQVLQGRSCWALAGGRGTELHVAPKSPALLAPHTQSWGLPKVSLLSFRRGVSFCSSSCRSLLHTEMSARFPTAEFCSAWKFSMFPHPLAFWSLSYSCSCGCIKIRTAWCQVNPQWCAHRQFKRQAFAWTLGSYQTDQV